MLKKSNKFSILIGVIFLLAGCRKTDAPFCSESPCPVIYNQAKFYSVHYGNRVMETTLHQRIYENDGLRTAKYEFTIANQTNDSIDSGTVLRLIRFDKTGESLQDSIGIPIRLDAKIAPRDTTVFKFLPYSETDLFTTDNSAIEIIHLKIRNRDESSAFSGTYKGSYYVFDSDSNIIYNSTCNGYITSDGHISLQLNGKKPYAFISGEIGLDNLIRGGDVKKSDGTLLSSYSTPNTHPVAFFGNNLQIIIKAVDGAAFNQIVFTLPYQE